MDLIGDYGSDASSSEDGEGKEGSQRREDRHIEIVSSRDVPDQTFVRSFPDIPGNWAGHVYCTIPDTWHGAMSESVQRFREVLMCDSSFRGGQLISHLESEVHMSLSRPFTLQLASVESFVERLNRRLFHLPTTTLCAHPLDEQILVNEEGTRSFWTWPIDPNPTLLAIVEEINAVLHIYNQPPYYDPPLFHISLASVVGALRPITKGDRKFPFQFQNIRNSAGSTPCFLPLTQIHTTFGTARHYTIHLLDK